MGEQPKQRHLMPPVPSSTKSELGESLETVWEMDVHDISWSIALSYLMTVTNDKAENFLKTILRSEPSLSERNIKGKAKYIKMIIRKYNPFRKGYNIQNSLAMKKFINLFRNFLFSDFNENNWQHVLQNVSVYLKCTIYLYSVDSKEDCRFFSQLQSPESLADCPKFIILCHSENMHNSSILPKLNFGLSSECEYMRKNCLNRVLRKIGLSEEEIEEIHINISTGKKLSNLSSRKLEQDHHTCSIQIPINCPKFVRSRFHHGSKTY